MDINKIGVLRLLLSVGFIINIDVTLAQSAVIDSFYIHGDIKVTIDKPASYRKNKGNIIVFYALPNGNTTDQTMGKKMQPGDDWHFDIQHIRAQTEFIRKTDKKNNYIVIYLENKLKSWPAWKQRNTDFKIRIPQIIESLSGMFHGPNKIYLNGHSGGGSFIFGYLAGVDKIPANIKRISFLDSNYGYDSTYFPKLRDWLKDIKGSALNVFAYNDSIALLNGKPFVSATGGTWWRTHLMAKHFREPFPLVTTETDSLIIAENKVENLRFYFKKNYNRGIYHTQQVELNGFIHSIFCGTRFDSKGYSYYGTRAYTEYIY